MNMKNMPLRSEDVREKNEKLILRYIQQSEGISQSEIVQLTGLKAPTVLRIFSILEGNGLIKVQKKVPDRGASDKKGRKPVYYKVVPNSRYVIGVEFWSRSAFILVIDFSKSSVFSSEVCFRQGCDAMEMYEEIVHLIDQAIESVGIPLEKILGIGVGAPGQVCVDDGAIIEYRKIPGFNKFPLGKMLKERYDCPIKVANNAGVFALNAYRQGVAKESDALFTFFIRRGVGGAFIHQGRLFSVLGKTAFEIGHTIVESDGKPCYCGAKGCLEAYISELAILEYLSEAGFPFSSMDEVEQQLSEGNTGVLDAVRRCGKYISLSAKNMMKILSPDGFLVITRYPTLSRVFADIISKSLSQEIEEGKLQVYSGQYSSHEAGMGACDLIFDHYFQNL